MSRQIDVESSVITAGGVVYFAGSSLLPRRPARQPALLSLGRREQGQSRPALHGTKGGLGPDKAEFPGGDGLCKEFAKLGKRLM
jgi:hypothetical protein